MALPAPRRRRCRHCKIYGGDDDGDEVLRRDFGAAYKKLTELGFTEFPPVVAFPRDAAGDPTRVPFEEKGLYGYPGVGADSTAAAS